MGAAFNAMMEEESKEWIANRCCELMDEVSALKAPMNGPSMDEIRALGWRSDGPEVKAVCSLVIYRRTKEDAQKKLNACAHRAQFSSNEARN